ncbi:sigma-70 family RNA polymerase sigma factor, partial [Myxococcota bacterium]|nr:sigma-70 family RNA polymerase sigma factor [Myxococcota bacterium]
MSNGKKKNPESKRNLPSVTSPDLVLEVEVDEDDVAIEPEEDIYAEAEEVDEVEETHEDRGIREVSEPTADSDSAYNLVRYDPYRAYMAQVRRYPLLSPEEEQHVAQEYIRTRKPELARRLVTANLRLVVKIAHEYHKSHNNLIDLIQEGNVGLLMAVDKFDPLRGVKLSTYSSWWIRAYILKYLLNNSRLVKIGTTQAQRKLFFNLNKQQEYLKSKGIVPTSDNIAEALDVPVAAVEEMQKRLNASDLSLSTPLRSDEGSSRTIMDTMEDSGSSPEEIVEADEIHRIILEKLAAFKARMRADLEKARGNRDEVLHVERYLVIMEDRLLSDSPLTLKEIGDRYG